ncbi:MAG: 16S rRNA (adenine1518-N6/adenine1519-N6)-dimethyltransferase [Parcubacteria group bacterium LiPW_15]|jgi:16S rRNA (adenine1518-N6/adenine1519-N6)-dimethyltransferase|nr:MAG: 16S rRNA (adenine1518-N6/adenine1519-N6)-dimethyltransferase [Parcubacteria group bacterium LiPW_15]
MGQKLGQHFLRDEGAIEKIISALGDNIKTVIEVGPGRGALTKSLAESLSSSGGRLIAIEKDPLLAAEAKSWDLKNLEIIEEDILVALPEVVSKLKDEDYALVGNIPYYLTGFLLRKISELEQKPIRTIFMIQKEVAERVVSKPPEMNRLSASIQFWADPKILKTVSKNSFNPPPKVDSAIILLETKKSPPKISAESYYSAVRAIFAQPRKTILNNLAAKFEDPRKIASEKAAQALEVAGLSPGLRPQDLSVEDILLIAKAIY